MPEPLRRRVPITIRISPEFVRSLGEWRAARPVSDPSTQNRGLVFGKVAEQIVTLQALRLVKVQSGVVEIEGFPKNFSLAAFAEAYRADAKLAPLDLLGWFSITSQSGFMGSDIEFHNSHFRRASDVALLLRPESDSDFSAELYSRSLTAPLSSENYNSGTLRFSCAPAPVAPLEFNVYSRIDESFFLRIYQQAEEYGEDTSKHQPVRRLLAPFKKDKPARWEDLPELERPARSTRSGPLSLAIEKELSVPVARTAAAAPAPAQVAVGKMQAAPVADARVFRRRHLYWALPLAAAIGIAIGIVVGIKALTPRQATPTPTGLPAAVQSQTPEKVAPPAQEHGPPREPIKIAPPRTAGPELPPQKKESPSPDARKPQPPPDRERQPQAFTPEPRAVALKQAGTKPATEPGKTPIVIEVREPAKRPIENPPVRMTSTMAAQSEAALPNKPAVEKTTPNLLKVEAAAPTPAASPARLQAPAVISSNAVSHVSPPLSEVMPTAAVPSPAQPLRQIKPDALGPGIMLFKDTTVRVRVIVDGQGRVTNPQLVASAERINQALIGLALRAAGQWQFVPASLNGQPVKSEYTIVFRFHANK